MRNNKGALDMVLGNNAPQERKTYCVDSLNKKLREHAHLISDRGSFKRGDVIRLNALGVEAALPDGTLQPKAEAIVVAWGKDVVKTTGSESADVELNLFNKYGEFCRIYGDSRMLELVEK